MKKLYLVRHAKSSWKDVTLEDMERPLNKRGLKNAPEMASRLNNSSVSVDLIISSPAKRTITTAHYVAIAIGYEIKKIEQNRKLYFDSSDSLLDLIKATDQTVKSLMLIGHNPDMTSLFNRLCGYQTENMPTCAVATIQLDGNWSDIEINTGKMMYYDYPKKSIN